MGMRLFLVLEMTTFGYLYFFGNNGIQILNKQCAGVVDLERNIGQLKNEIEHIEQEMYAWQTDDFYKEKVAREQLQMARKGDELFYIGV